MKLIPKHLTGGVDNTTFYQPTLYQLPSLDGDGYKWVSENSPEYQQELMKAKWYWLADDQHPNWDLFLNKTQKGGETLRKNFIKDFGQQNFDKLMLKIGTPTARRFMSQDAKTKYTVEQTKKPNGLTDAIEFLTTSLALAPLAPVASAVGKAALASRAGVAATKLGTTVAGKASLLGTKVLNSAIGLSTKAAFPIWGAYEGGRNLLSNEGIAKTINLGKETFTGNYDNAFDRAKTGAYFLRSAAGDALDIAGLNDLKLLKPMLLHVAPETLRTMLNISTDPNFVHIAATPTIVAGYTKKAGELEKGLEGYIDLERIRTMSEQDFAALSTQQKAQLLNLLNYGNARELYDKFIQYSGETQESPFSKLRINDAKKLKDSSKKNDELGLLSKALYNLFLDFEKNGLIEYRLPITKKGFFAEVTTENDYKAARIKLDEVINRINSSWYGSNEVTPFTPDEKKLLQDFRNTDLFDAANDLLMSHLKPGVNPLKLHRHGIITPEPNSYNVVIQGPRRLGINLNSEFDKNFVKPKNLDEATKNFMNSLLRDKKNAMSYLQKAYKGYLDLNQLDNFFKAMELFVEDKLKFADDLQKSSWVTHSSTIDPIKVLLAAAKLGELKVGTFHMGDLYKDPTFGLKGIVTPFERSARRKTGVTYAHISGNTKEHNHSTAHALYYTNSLFGGNPDQEQINEITNFLFKNLNPFEREFIEKVTGDEMNNLAVWAYLALNGKNVGLQVGKGRKPLDKLMVDWWAEAMQKGATEQIKTVLPSSMMARDVLGDLIARSFQRLGTVLSGPAMSTRVSGLGFLVSSDPLKKYKWIDMDYDKYDSPTFLEQLKEKDLPSEKGINFLYDPGYHFNILENTQDDKLVRSGAFSSNIGVMLNANTLIFKNGGRLKKRFIN